ncbi:MAG: hypothetical protein RL375_2813 [Pseudomonadota bacterium]
MARIREDCRWCTPALVTAVVLVGWFGFVHGPARPDQLRLRAEESVARELSAAGFPWARLKSRGDTAVLTGEAPSDEARAAAAAAADVLLARFVGWPGVYAQVDKNLQVAAGAADRQALAAARLAVARTDEPLDLPATSAGPAAALATPGAPTPGEVNRAAMAAAPVASVPGAAAVVASTSPAAPAGTDASAQPLQRPDPTCQRELMQVQQQAPLRFKSGAATLDYGQDDAVDGLARLLKRCQAGRVLVHGLREAPGAAAPSTTDETAEAEAGDKAAPMGGLLLAQRRAQAVRAELVARGVAPSRLQLGAGAREVLGDSPARVELTLAPAGRS